MYIWAGQRTSASLAGENVAGVVAGSRESIETFANNSLVKLKRMESQYDAGMLDTEGLHQVTACGLTGLRVQRRSCSGLREPVCLMLTDALLQSRRYWQ